MLPCGQQGPWAADMQLQCHNAMASSLSWRSHNDSLEVGTGKPPLEKHRSRSQGQALSSGPLVPSTCWECVPSSHQGLKLPEVGFMPQISSHLHGSLPRSPPNDLRESLCIRPDLGSNTSFATQCCVTWDKLLNLSEPWFFFSLLYKMTKAATHVGGTLPKTQLHMGGNGVLLWRVLPSTIELGTRQDGRV